LSAIERFEKLEFNYQAIRNHALKFSKERFEKEIEEFVNEKYKLFQQERL